MMTATKTREKFTSKITDGKASIWRSSRRWI